MMRLQRFLAQAGVASRRKCEELIVARRITVNGKIADELGTRVDAHKDTVTVDGRKVLAQDHVWLVLHKPPQTICSTSDPEGRETVLDLIHIRNVRLFPVGRLDYATSGVLLITNDGELTERMLHPRNELPRTYHVKIQGPVATSELDRLREGVIIEGGQRVRADMSLVASTGLHTWVEMTIRQGINHQVHRMWEVLERRVLRLIRVEFGGIRADSLPPGKYRVLTQQEVNELRARYGLKGETRRERATAGPGRRGGKGRTKASTSPKNTGKHASAGASAHGEKSAYGRKSESARGEKSAYGRKSESAHGEKSTYG
ncbi:MAG: rRNA pseudouridine synthase, partial [Deltaproteobacteria bacterium]|nr:rRNA pseudouridine synthase [Deltaproteobacteria bacterium]